MYTIWHRVRWWMRVILGLLAAAATTYAVIDASRNRADPAWYFSGRLLVPAGIVLGVAALWNVADGVLARSYEQRTSAVGRSLDKYLYVLHRDISKHQRDRVASVSRTSRKTLNRIGLHVWLVPTWYRSINRRGHAPMKLVSLWRASEIRFIDDDLSPTEITWRPGIGVIGTCWVDKQVTKCTMANSWPALALTEQVWKATWEGLPEVERIGLNPSQAYKIAQNYRSVVAVPIYWRDRTSSHSTFLGCLVLDVPRDGLDFDPTNEPIVRLLRQASKRIGEQMKVMESVS